MTTYLVTGAPCSGKSTWVSDQAEPGDLVLDLDTIAAAIAPANPPHQYDDVIARIGLAMVNAALADLPRDRDVYVIRCTSGKREREQLQARLRAELVHLHVTHDQAVKRADAAARPLKTYDAIAAYFKQPLTARPGGSSVRSRAW